MVVVVHLHLAVVLVVLHETGQVGQDGGCPGFEGGGVGDWGPSAILEHVELHHGVLSVIVLHLLARSIEVPVLPVDPVVPAPESLDLQVVGHVGVA